MFSMMSLTIGLRFTRQQTGSKSLTKECDMATVRFSKELQDDIIKRAKAVFDKQLTAAEESRPDATAWGEKIYNTLFGEYTPILNAVPQEFLYMVDQIEIGRVGDTRCHLRFILSTPRPWTRKFKDTEYARANSGYDSTSINLLNHPAWAEFQAEIKAWQERVTAVQNKRTEFVEQVKKIIEAHATLAPALKMWPPLWDLVPEKYKEKHREIVERTKKDVAVQVDLGALTAAVVANKIGG
jgi:hypothetical protein